MLIFSSSEAQMSRSYIATQRQSGYYKMEPYWMANVLHALTQLCYFVILLFILTFFQEM